MSQKLSNNSAVLATFLAHCVKDMMQLKRVLKRSDTDALKLVAQQISASVAEIGAQDTCHLAQQLESQASSLSAQDKQAMCNQLVTDYQQLIQQVRSHQQRLEKQPNPNSQSATDVNSVLSQLNALDLNIDREESIKRCGGSVELYKKLLLKFVDMYGNGFTIASHELQAFTHSIKGAASYLGLTDIAELAARSEQALKLNADEQVLIAQLEELTIRVCEQLKRQLTAFTT
ncbi:Hpt domain-containing protein [Echinimonas agarilytica]|uniref:Hpt domain-containing protein n=1 Tax=Echinimonas agarilytica TaxID=1215918 RepID=A0AA41W6X3_9GAMM|nr:Hpt domain-containing protein [Echinimonas agarilytica]MCM2679633.1 Hpt domain-containing protein [Echinimonas agarilytica]